MDNEEHLIEFSDDEELQKDIKDLATGKATAKKSEVFNPWEKNKDFDAEDSYFSEDEEELEQDEIKAWQKETHQFRFNKGDFMDPVE